MARSVILAGLMVVLAAGCTAGRSTDPPVSPSAVVAPSGSAASGSAPSPMVSSSVGGITFERPSPWLPWQPNLHDPITARIQVERPGSCATIGGDETIDVLVPTSMSATMSNVAVVVCLRGPDLATSEAAVRAMLTSATEHP